MAGQALGEEGAPMKTRSAKLSLLIELHLDTGLQKDHPSQLAEGMERD